MKGFGIFSQIFLLILLLIVIFSSSIKRIISAPFCLLSSINPVLGRIGITSLSMIVMYLVLKVEESLMPSYILHIGKSINLVTVIVGGLIVYFLLAGIILKC